MKSSNKVNKSQALKTQYPAYGLFLAKAQLLCS